MNSDAYSIICILVLIAFSIVGGLYLYFKYPITFNKNADDKTEPPKYVMWTIAGVWFITFISIFSKVSLMLMSESEDEK